MIGLWSLPYNGTERVTDGSRRFRLIAIPPIQVRIAGAGRPFETPGYQPYVTGEGLGIDRAFVGRSDLIDWLRGL